MSATDSRPLVTDIPFLKYTGNDGIVLIHRVPVNEGWVDVVGDPANASYEWVLRSPGGKITKHSDDGYGDSAVALFDGLAEAHRFLLHDADGNKAVKVIQHLVEADLRCGYSTALREKINVQQGGESNDAESAMLGAFEQAHAFTGKLNAPKGK